jgi:hypothetical protein
MNDTQDFSLTPTKQVKQNISFAMIGLDQIRDEKMDRVRKLSDKEIPLNTLDQAAYDTLIDEIKALTFKIAILNTVAETLR